jgi:rare lipoprotein A
MLLNPLFTQNWSRTFSVWIEDIQVQFQPVAKITLSGGFLRRVRSITPMAAGLVALVFMVHCSHSKIQPRPQNSPEPPSQGSSREEGASETGGASWYGSKADGLVGRRTASGEPMNPSLLACAHRTLPLGSYVRVENIENGRRAILRVNDRGPFVRNRILDVTRQAADDSGFLDKGLAKVRVTPFYMEGSQGPRVQKTEKDNPYTIQVAALSDSTNIERLSKELKPVYGNVFLQNAIGKGGQQVVRVQVGSYASMEEAEKASTEIAKRFGDHGVDPFITRRR